jgi:type I restriction enzyme, S subunit
VIVPVSGVGVVRLGRQRSPDKQTGRHPTRYIRAANITPDGLDLTDLLQMDFTPTERALFRLNAGDVVLTEASGSASQVGRAALWPETAPECCYQNTIIRFRPHAVVPEYALIVFRHFAAAGIFARTARGIGIQHLGGSRFAQLPFPLPPLPEQQRIAIEVENRHAGLRQAHASLVSALARIDEQNREILSAASNGELLANEAMQQERELGEKATSIGEVSAETLDQPSLFDTVTDGRPEIIEALWEHPLPTGWQRVRVGDAGELKLGQQRSPKHQRGSNPTPYLRVANVQEDAIDLENLKMMDFSPAEQQEYRVVRGDILLNVGQSPELVGRPALVREDVPLIGFQNHLVRFRPKSFVDAEYALIVFRHYLHVGIFRSVSYVVDKPRHARPFAPRCPAVPTATAPSAASDCGRSPPTAERLASGRAGHQVLDRTAPSAGSGTPRGRSIWITRSTDAADEPASALLDRLGPPIEEARPRTLNLNESEDDENVAPDKPSNQDFVVTHPRLASILRSSGRPMTVPELFSMARFDHNSAEDIEQFYLALRSELGHFIRVIETDPEHALLEAVADAAR